MRVSTDEKSPLSLISIVRFSEDPNLRQFRIKLHSEIEEVVDPIY